MEEKEARRKTILIVDDEMIWCKYLSSFLGEWYTVVTASDGEIGLEEYKRVRPDLVLTDFRMPGMNGLEFLEKIKSIDQSTPVIILSAYLDKDSMRKAFSELGECDCILKSKDFEEVKQSIDDALRTRDSELEAHRPDSLIFEPEEENKRLKERPDNPPAQQSANLPSNEEAEKYKFILGVAAHGLKGEFLHINNSAHTIRDLSGDSPEIKEECDLIERSVEYSQLLLRRLLNYIDIGNLQVQSIIALELAERVEWLARPRLPSNISFEVKVEQSAEKESVSADAEQLIGALLELIQNAASALHGKGGNIKLRFEAGEGELTISVEDNGPGIPKEIKETLLKEQVPSKRGTGLGLFLSGKVISAMGGRLELQHSSKRGTVFTISLPTVKARKRS